jgi:hypothetical protein
MPTGSEQEHAALVALVAEWQEITREFRDAGDDWKSAQAKRWRRAVDALLAFPLPSGCVTTSAMVVNQPSDHNYEQAATSAAPAGDPVGEPQSTAGICDQCRGPHVFDTSVPSVLWNQVIRGAGLPDYLCTTCVVRAFAAAGVSFTAHLYGEGFNGTPIDVTVRGVEPQTVELLEEQNNVLRVALCDVAPSHPALVAAREPVEEPEPSEALTPQRWETTIRPVPTPQPIAPPPAPAAGDVLSDADLAAMLADHADLMHTFEEAARRDRYDYDRNGLNYVAECLGDSIKAIQALAALRRVSPAAVEPHAVRQEPTWQPIETAPQMRKIVVFYRNALGKGRTVLACYYRENALEMDDDYADVGTYDEASGTSYATAGWYEEHEHDSPLMPLDEQPTHWMPLPPAPREGGEAE